MYEPLGLQVAGFLPKSRLSGEQFTWAATEETTAAMEEMSSQAKALLDEANNLRGLIEKFKL